MNAPPDRTDPPSVRLAHLSDVHITTTPLGWQRRDWFSKRVTGYINLRWLGRRRRFRSAAEVLPALVGDIRRPRPDHVIFHVIFSGDATNLGFEAEFSRATALLGLDSDEPLPGLAVPGNHDYYTRAVVAAGVFERHFAAWQEGKRVDDEHHYPFAQQVGPLWLVAVNSCVANRWVGDARGQVGNQQLDRLERLLDGLGPGLRVLVTHYPVCRASGKREVRGRELRDLDELVAVAKRGGISLWLHGHRHGAYQHARTRLTPFPVICAGSATQNKRWSYGEYTIHGRRLVGLRRLWDPERRDFRDSGHFEFELPAPPSSGQLSVASGQLGTDPGHGPPATNS
jgi:3',5'-cyclic AMP phosphodiesterase CpdA